MSGLWTGKRGQASLATTHLGRSQSAPRAAFETLESRGLFSCCYVPLWARLEGIDTSLVVAPSYAATNPSVVPHNSSSAPSASAGSDATDASTEVVASITKAQFFDLRTRLETGAMGLNVHPVVLVKPAATSPVTLDTGGSSTTALSTPAPVAVTPITPAPVTQTPTSPTVGGGFDAGAGTVFEGSEGGAVTISTNVGGAGSLQLNESNSAGFQSGATSIDTNGAIIATGVISSSANSYILNTLGSSTLLSSNNLQPTHAIGAIGYLPGSYVESNLGSGVLVVSGNKTPASPIETFSLTGSTLSTSQGV